MKSYKTLLASAVAVCALAGFTSCDDDFDRPPVIVPTATYEVNTAIADFKQEFWQWTQGSEFTTIPVNAQGDSIIIGGRITTSDALGNVYKYLVVEDESAAIYIGVNMNDIYKSYQPGQEVHINVTGLLVGNYGSTMQIGGLYDNKLGRMEEDVFKVRAQQNGLASAEALAAAVIDVDLAELNAHSKDAAWLQKYQSRMIRLKGVTFDGGGSLMFSDNPGNTQYTNRNLTDDAGNKIVVRTSNSCKFASAKLPAGKGTVVGLLGYFNGAWQLAIVNPETDCTDFDGTPSQPEGPDDAIFSQTFADGKGDFTIENVKTPASMPEIWKHDSKYKYMIATAYESATKTNHASESWLVSPVIDLSAQKSAYLSYEQALNYFASLEAAKSEATVAVREEGTTDWTTLTVTSWPTAMGWTFVPSGDIDISAFAGKKVRIGFRYTSTDAKAGTWELKNVTVKPTGNSAPEPPTPPAGDKGSKDKPYTVAEAIALNNPGTAAWVEGYIVGSAPGKSADTFTTATGADASNTNLFLGASAAETDYTKCLAVQLPAALRDALSLQKNPGNLGKKLAITGTLTKYFGMAGLKEATEYVLDGKEGGGGETPVTPPAGGIFSETFESGLGSFKAQDVKLPSGLSYVWSHYANANCAKASAYVGQAYEADSYLISPVIDLSSASAPTLSFSHATNFYGDEATARAQTAVCIRVEGTTSWTVLQVPSYPATQGWQFTESGSISLAAFAGKKVEIAFHYTSTTAMAGTWEIKNLIVK